jgi:hypothetical protein
MPETNDILKPSSCHLIVQKFQTLVSHNSARHILPEINHTHVIRLQSYNMPKFSWILNIILSMQILILWTWHKVTSHSCFRLQFRLCIEETVAGHGAKEMVHKHNHRLLIQESSGMQLESFWSTGLQSWWHKDCDKLKFIEWEDVFCE